MPGSGLAVITELICAKILQNNDNGLFFRMSFIHAGIKVKPYK